MTGGTPSTHWETWHLAYEEQGSPLRRRLAVVESELAAALEASPPGPVRVLSLCSGDARDLLDVLEDHPRAGDVTATLVDLEASLLDRAAARARALRAEVTCTLADAGWTPAYVDAAPAEVVLACGIFGNVSDDDVHRTVDALRWLVRPGGHVLWTRHRRPPDLTPRIRGWFADAGFEERRFVAVPGTTASVGHHVLAGAPTGSGPPERIFTFVGDGSGGTG